MTFEEALEDVLIGRAVSRRAWRDPNLLVRLVDPGRSGIDAARTATGAAVQAPWPLENDDRRADDWFVVGAVN
jgi:hypothetical protein